MPFISKFIAAEIPDLLESTKDMNFPNCGLNPTSCISVASARSFSLKAERSGFPLRADEVGGLVFVFRSFSDILPIGYLTPTEKDFFPRVSIPNLRPERNIFVCINSFDMLQTK